MTTHEPWQPFKRCLISSDDLLDFSFWLTHDYVDMGTTLATSALIADSIIAGMVNGEPKAT